MDQFCTSLAGRAGLSVLDFAGANQNTVSFLTGQGHRLYSDDLLLQLERFFGVGDFYENQEDARRAEEFMETALPFPDDSFDGALVWDCLQYLAPSLLGAVVEKLRRMLRPDSFLLAFFNAQEQPGAVTAYSYRIQDHRTILLSPRGEMRPAQFFNNRSLEKLFQDFASVKFFLTRDHLREVIVRR